ncbi:MAG: hypothetical protein EBT79_09770 [Actinobacteria bacterium]|nr:hypothetical protein [Actinomycetota bacterium]NBR67542.1 hypothetical protein [Actinomycetota bacterium]
MSLHGTIMAHIVRMQPGDVLWVRLGPDTDVEDAENIRDAVLSAMPRECSIILTEHDLVDRMGAASINDLVELRRVIDRAIDYKMANTTITHEA